MKGCITCSVEKPRSAFPPHLLDTPEIRSRFTVRVLRQAQPGLFAAEAAA